MVSKPLVSVTNTTIVLVFLLLLSSIALSLASSLTCTATSEMAAALKRLPAFFISHGGGPCFFMDSTGTPFEHMNRKSKAAAWYRNFAQREGFEGGNKPKAILIISAHWEAQPVRILSPKTPIPLLYDYYGFPKHTYELKYEARGDAHVASRVSQLLSSAGIKNKEETSRGYDHGVFIPLMLMFPQADIPVIQLSLDSDLDPAVHLSIGKALQPLRDEGVLIIGSGFITHDLSFRLSDKQAIEFVDSVTNVMQLSGAERDQQLSQWHKLPHGRAAHPREEHLIPLLVSLGAGGHDSKVTTIGTDLAPPPLLFTSYRFD